MTGSFSERIRKARKHIGLSATEAASMAGLTRKSWERYELDINEPKASSLSMLVERGIDANWLLTGKGNMIQSQGDIPETAALDPDLLRIIIEELETFRQAHKPVWDSTQVARIIVLAYAMMVAERQKGNIPDPASLRFLMQAAAL
ncbi:MAG: helix-turn-helix transcriptional regulator [Pseudomonadota bacterium]